MHKKTLAIITNLGFGTTVVDVFKRAVESHTVNRKAVSQLKKLGFPRTALKQIKELERGDSKLIGRTNKQLLEHLIKRCRRSLDAFSHRGVEAKIIFYSGAWTTYSELHDKNIDKLHSVCKPHFDECAEYGLKAILSFDGTQFWQVTTEKRADLPDNL